MSKKQRFNPIIYTKDDQLKIPEVGSWSIEKYQYVGGYCEIFTNSMKNKWNELIYIDLFAGSGFSKLKDSGKIIYASPLIALSTPTPFTKFIFCEKDQENFNALEDRVKRLFPNRDVTMFNGDSNDIILDIKSAIPKFSKERTGLSFCFIDPFSLNLHFNTIKQLSDLRLDFLILLAFHMDANRNFRTYYDKENYKIDCFLDDKKWRESLEEDYLNDPKRFVEYLGQRYRENMEHLGYISTDTFERIKSDTKNLPLYYLAFFSKNNLGSKFWKEVQKYSNSQLSFKF